MLTPKELKTFFEDNKIPLESSSFLGRQVVESIFSKGLSQSYYFASFLLIAIFNTEKDSFQCFFKDEDDRYEAYACYMTGCYGAKC